jgi:aldose sugar dehydrogenase
MCFFQAALSPLRENANLRATTREAGVPSIRSQTATALALLLALGAAGAASQPAPPAPPPSFPPGPDYAGVAGSPEENARITALCGRNRNAADGYAPKPAFPGQTRAPGPSKRQPFAVETVAKIDRPWGAAFLPDGKMLVTIRAGGMRVVDTSGSVSEPLAGVPKIETARLAGMYDLVLDRHFAKNRTLYFGYVTRSGAAGTPPVGRIVKARLSQDGRSLEDLVTLREGADIAPRRIVQLRDGTLLIASAEVASGGPNPQSLQSQIGKILRINTDGTIPKDNPYQANPEANPALYAVGFRDVHGLAVEPRTGQVWVAENTPMGGDELNLIRPGRNYGFPVISYGRENGGQLINGGRTAQDGMEQPVYYWNPSIAPSGLLFYTGSALPGWKGSAFIGAMSGQQLVRLEMRNGRVVGEEKLLLERCTRLKTVAQGPDGLIYILTDMPQAEILRLVPASRTAAR